MGRPSTYTDQIAAEIIDRIGKGEPLAQICRDDHMPDRTTVYDWLKANEALSQRFARARDDGFDALAAECLAIADTPVRGVQTVTKPDGAVETREEDMLGHRKLQIETRLKLLAKWDPKRYGDKLELGGALGVAVTINRFTPEADAS